MKTQHKRMNIEQTVETLLVSRPRAADRKLLQIQTQPVRQ